MNSDSLADRNSDEGIVNIETIVVTLTHYQDDSTALAVIPNKSIDAYRAIGMLEAAKQDIIEGESTYIEPLGGLND